MASIYPHPKSGFYCIRFRYNGRNINRSLKTRDKRRAASVHARVEETLRLVESGRITIPLHVKPVEFILADGRETQKATTPKRIGLKALFELYQERLPKGSKEESTLFGERIHLKHFMRHLGPNRFVQAIVKADLQDYVEKRLGEPYRGRQIRPDTIRKELVTFRMLWNWAVGEGLLIGASPTKKVILPLSDEKPPFRTKQEIEMVLRRGGLDEYEASQLWESLYLSADEVSAVLELIKENATIPFVYPMMVFVAHTGARRSEMLRSQPEDLDFTTRTVLLREKKKSRKKGVTFRRVPMSELLEQTMRTWLTTHPGCTQTFCQVTAFDKVVPLTEWSVRHHYKQALADTEWNIIRGFHVFRHSFASSLAAAGVDERVIDEFMGHQTTEMRCRYRHLFPDQQHSAINAVFGSNNAPDKEPSTIPFRVRSAKC